MSSSAAKPRSTWSLGLVATGFFALHALCQIHAGRPENLLWACHVADLSVGLGLLIRWPTLTAGGVLMLAVGIPLWLINLYFGGAFYPTSILTHLGPAAIGLIGLRRLPSARYDWLTAVALVAALIIASRAVTSPARNVNLAFSAWQTMGPLLDSPEFHVLALLALWTVALWGCRKALVRLHLLRIQEPVQEPSETGSFCDRAPSPRWSVSKMCLSPLSHTNPKRK